MATGAAAHGGDDGPGRGILSEMPGGGGNAGADHAGTGAVCGAGQGAMSAVWRCGDEDGERKTEVEKREGEEECGSVGELIQ